MTTLTLLVLAAGMGSRYGGLKQIESVGPHDETILDYSIYDAVRAGFGKVVFVIRKEIELQFREIVGARFEKYVEVEYVFQELENLPPGYSVPAGRTKPWGTTHAVLMAESAISGPFSVINADDFYGVEGYRLVAQYLESGAGGPVDYAMVGFILRNTLSEFGPVSRGICSVTGAAFLQGVVELTKIERDDAGVANTDSTGFLTRLTGDELVSMNMWGLTPTVFGQLREQFQKFLESSGGDLKAECYLPSAVNELVLSGQARVKVLPTNDPWFGITYSADRNRVVESISRLIASGSYPERLFHE